MGRGLVYFRLNTSFFFFANCLVSRRIWCVRECNCFFPFFRSLLPPTSRLQSIYIGLRFSNVLNYYSAEQIVRPRREHSHSWSPHDWMLRRAGMRTRDKTDGRGGQGTKIGTPCRSGNRASNQLIVQTRRSGCRSQRRLHHFSFRVIRVEK